MPTFLTLPPELRLEIYRPLLVLPPPPPPTSHQTYYRCPSPPVSPNSTSSNGHPPRIHTAILLVNRQTHREATPLLYTHNLFTPHPTELTAPPSPYTPPSSAHRPRRTPICPAYARLVRRWYIRLRLDAPPQWGRGGSGDRGEGRGRSKRAAADAVREAAREAFSFAEEVTLELWRGSFYVPGAGAGSQHLQHQHHHPLPQEVNGVVGGVREGEQEFGGEEEEEEEEEEEVEGMQVLRQFELVRGVKRVQIVGMVAGSGLDPGFLAGLVSKMMSVD
ncbi:hypothetical protein VTK26DRAFT_5304 [Humicola hyalothermophila]